MQIASASCVMIKDLGFTACTHIKMYGQLFEIVSEPFDEADGISVRATSGSDPKIRILRLPVAILVGRTDRFLASRRDRTNQLVDALPGLIQESEA